MDFYLLASFNVILGGWGFDIPAIIQLSDQTIQKIKYVSGLLKDPEVKSNGIVSFTFEELSIFLHENYQKELEALLEKRKNLDYIPSHMESMCLVKSHQGFENKISYSLLQITFEGKILIEFTAYCSEASPEDALFRLSEELDIETFVEMFSEYLENKGSF
jgi:hypothetical protein